MNMPDVVTRVRQAAKRLPLMPRTFALVWNAAPGWNLLWLILLAVQSIIPVGIVTLTRLLVDGLAEAIGGGLGWDNIRGPVLVAAAMGGLQLLSMGLQGVTGWVTTIQGEIVRDVLTRRIHAQSIALDYRHYEDPDFYDRLHRARAGGAGLPLAQVTSMGSMLQSSLTLVAMTAVLLRYGPWVPLALLIGTAPTLFIVIRNSRRLYRWSRESTPEQRRVWYYDWLITARDNAAELRQFGLGEYWKRLYEQHRIKLRKERLSLARRQAAGQFAAGAIGMAAGGAALAWMGRGAMRGALSLGDIALFAQAFNQGQSLIRSLLQNSGQMYTNLLYLGDFFEFLDMIPDRENGVEPQPRIEMEPETESALGTRPAGMRIEDIAFTYPGSKTPAVNGLSLDIAAGKITAVVGENGAGKSTLIKLLTRLHEPSEGRIFWNGRDIRDIPPDEIRKRTAVLLQNPMHYQETVGTNIRLGRLEAGPEDVREAARASGAAEFVERLPRDYETQLGRMFEGGVDLSIGEWQKLALARALARPAEIFLLDEPTSALDAWAEADWYTRLRRALGGRTALIITHRLTTAQRADRVYVMTGGRIVESGTPEELLAGGGRYAEAWASQTQSFETPPSIKA
jgi:ATP-binding cassette, subfamily B, bacterial